MEDQGKCYGCEQHRKDYKAGWKGRSRLYINVLVDDGKEDPYVAILSQGSSGKTVTPTLIEYAGEMGSISNLMWRIKRSGTKTDTSYTIIPLAKDESVFDTSSLDLFDLETSAVRDLPYTEQEAFFAGEASQGEEQSSSASSGSVDW
jgi:nitric oxide synthase oxygenase domain/subunit